MNAGFRATEVIRGANPKHPAYPIYPGDLLVQEPRGTWTKEAPGICLLGFVLTPEQVANLTPVTFQRYGLDYVVDPVTS